MTDINSSIISNYLEIWLNAPQSTTIQGPDGFGYEFDNNGQIAAIYDLVGNCIGYHEEQYFVIEQEDGTRCYYEIDEDGFLNEVDPNELQTVLPEFDDQFSFPQASVLCDTTPNVDPLSIPSAMQPQLANQPATEPIAPVPSQTQNPPEQAQAAAPETSTNATNNPAALMLAAAQTYFKVQTAIFSTALLPLPAQLALNIFANNPLPNQAAAQGSTATKASQNDDNQNNIQGPVDSIGKLANRAIAAAGISSYQVSFSNTLLSNLERPIVLAQQDPMAAASAIFRSGQAIDHSFEVNQEARPNPFMINFPTSRAFATSILTKNPAITTAGASLSSNVQTEPLSGLWSWPSVNPSMNEAASRAATSAFMPAIFELARIAAAHTQTFISASRANSRKIVEIHPRGDNGRQQDGQESDGRNPQDQDHQDQNPEEEES